VADHIDDLLTRLGACSDAVAWARTQPDAETAWDTCDRGDWMLWLAGRLAGEPGSDARRPLVLAACECARLALPYVKEGELRPMRAIEAAEDWARGGATTLAQVRSAAEADYAAYTVAAYAAASAASAAYVAAAAAADAAYAAYVAAAAAARSSTLNACADIVRKHYPHPPTENANG